MTLPALTNAPANRRPAFTLAEMLVVLVILAVMTLVAVESLAPVADQARYEATRRTIESIHRALVGDDSNGSETVSGYVADTGQLPASLLDLLVRPASVPSYGLQTIPGTPYQVSGGWRGPYLTAPYGAFDSDTGLLDPLKYFRDGWGDPLTLLPPTASVPYYQIACTPAVGREVPPPAIIERGHWHPEIEGTLYHVADGSHEPPGGSGTWRVFVYGIGPAGVQGLPAGGIPVDNASGFYQLDLNDLSVTSGPRVIQATLDGQPNGVPFYINLKGGSRHVVNLKVVLPSTLPPTSPDP